VTFASSPELRPIASRLAAAVRSNILLLSVVISAVGCSQPAGPSCADWGFNNVKVQCLTPGSRLECQAIAFIDDLHAANCSQTQDVTSSAVWKVDDLAIVRLVAPGEFEAVSVGRTAVHALWQGHDSADWLLRPVAVFPGTPPLLTGELEGSVYDPSHRFQVAGAVVRILDGLVAGQTSITGVPPPLLPGYIGPSNIGGFRLLGVPPGTYRLRMTMDGYVPQDGNATVTETGAHTILEFVLR